MRIALFGGSFDPPHSGHSGIAVAALERLHLDRVLMAPVGRQPLKRDQAQSPFSDRMAMVELACMAYPAITASDIDAPRPDGRFNFTYDTLTHLRETRPPGDDLFCLIGADSLSTLRHWHRAAEALMLAQWIVAARPGFTMEALPDFLPSGVDAGDAVCAEADQRIPLRLSVDGTVRQQTLWLLPGLHYDVSATELRAALAADSSGIPRRILDPKVAEYARLHHLYDPA